MATKILFFSLITINLLACQSVNTVKPEVDERYNPFSAMVRFYRGPLNHLSAVRIGQCPMYPSDSDYSLQSLEKHGMIMGWMMTLDRLMRCGRDETKLAPRVLVDGKWKSYDPVEKNDFWWYTPASNTSSAPQGLVPESDEPTRLQ